MLVLLNLTKLYFHTYNIIYKQAVAYINMG